jgi:hypothetical protein
MSEERLGPGRLRVTTTLQSTASVPRGPAGPAARRYLLAGLLACGRCGRRLESGWSHGRPAYRCRHGHTSATVPDPARPKTTYLREDEVLPHLAALAILRAGQAAAPRRGTRALAPVTGPADAAVLIDQPRCLSGCPGCAGGLNSSQTGWLSRQPTLAR